jgi:hypothetical protein
MRFEGDGEGAGARAAATGGRVTSQVCLAQGIDPIHDASIERALGKSRFASPSTA